MNERDDDTNTFEDDDTDTLDDEDTTTPEEAAAAKAAEVSEWENAMREYASKNGGIVPPQVGGFFSDENRLVRLPESKTAMTETGTEALLNGLIEDCRFLIREVVYHSARLTPDPRDRLSFLTAAKTLAITGAKVGQTIAQLRGDKPAQIEESRHRMIIEHVQTSSRDGGKGEGGTKSR